MSNGRVTIAVDAMGGENSPFKVLKGAEIFQSTQNDVDLIFYGEEDKIKKNINKHKIVLKNFSIINTFDNVKDDDNVNTILRSRKNSSIFQALEFVKKNPNSGFVSAGNTAAIMVLSRLHLGMIKGIDRPAICSLIPNKKNYSLMLDLGANVSVNPENLFQFAVMGFCYFSIIDKNHKPKIGILNIGTEMNKGLEFLQDGANLISKSFLNEYFIGFIEPNNVTSGKCDIIISDGYAGNIMLKTAEGISDFITSNLKVMFKRNLVNKLAYKMIEGDLTKLKNQVNPEIYNGANLIGLNGTSIKSHGNATSLGFSHAISKCYSSIKNNLNQQIINSINVL
tara:strand:- start:375 stop:1388 length:1014 start_codon:yes stop_codon:yes gene_type:complete